MNLWTDFQTKPPALDAKKSESVLKRLKPVLEPKWSALEEPHKANSANAWTALEKANAVTERAPWATSVKAAASALRKHLGAASIMLDEAQDELLGQLEVMATEITDYDANSLKAHELVVKWLPHFIYISDFPELNGHQDLQAFIEPCLSG